MYTYVRVSHVFERRTNASTGARSFPDACRWTGQIEKARESDEREDELDDAIAKEKEKQRERERRKEKAKETTVSGQVNGT